MSFENISYKEFASRFLEFNTVVAVGNPRNITVEQADSMLKALNISYLNLTEDLTKMQAINAPELQKMACRKFFEFERTELSLF